MTESTVIRGERASARSRRPIRDGGRPQRPIAAADREYALFAAMVAVVALHVADDSFLQPQPGTSAGDHLVSGFVPLAALALAVAGYPRLRGGGRAAIPTPTPGTRASTT